MIFSTLQLVRFLSVINMDTSGRALIDPYKVFSKVGLKPGMRIADFGCGRTGHFVFPASKIIGDAGVIYAVDILKDVLNSINSWVRSEGFVNIQTVWSDIEALNKTPIPSNSLEACFFMNVLSSLKKYDNALKEAYRLLKDGGTIAVVDWSRNLGTLGPSQVLPVEVIEKIANGIGLKKIEDFLLNDYHYCIVFKK